MKKRQKLKPYKESTEFPKTLKNPIHYDSAPLIEYEGNLYRMPWILNCEPDWNISPLIAHNVKCIICKIGSMKRPLEILGKPLVKHIHNHPSPEPGKRTINLVNESYGLGTVRERERHKFKITTGFWDNIISAIEGK